MEVVYLSEKRDPEGEYWIEDKSIKGEEYKSIKGESRSSTGPLEDQFPILGGFLYI